MSRFFQQLVAAYMFMENNSKVNEHGERIYEGSLTDVIKQTGVSSRHYSDLRGLLLSPFEDPCIEIYQRGNSHQLSRVILRHAPSAEWEKISPGDLTGRGRAATLGLELEDAVHNLKAWRESLGEVNLRNALINFETRITRLENQVMEWEETRENGKTKT